MATASDGFGMTVSPAVIPAGQSTVTIIDSGKTPLRLVTQAVSLNSKCQPDSEVSWARITPAAITLAPGQRETATVHLGRVPAGTHDIAVMFESLGGGKGQVRVNAELGARDVVTGQGHAAHAAAPCAVATAPSGTTSQGFPLALTIVAVAIVAAIVAATAAYRIGWHHRGTRAAK
jgi:hypothetical protein